MTKIIQRHDTAANWTSVNPVLTAGEMGVEYADGTVTFTLSDSVITNGSPTYSNGIASNFSASNYYSMNSLTIEEFNIQFTTETDINYGQYISTYPSLNIENGYLRLGLDSFKQLMQVSASTQYNIKIINYDSKVEVYSNSTLIATYNQTLGTHSPRFGSNTDGYPFKGSIDFRNTSVNGQSLTTKTEVLSGTAKFKFGDGATAWADLAYAAGEGGSGSGTILTSTDGTTTYSKLALGDNLVVIPPEIAWTNPQMSSNSQDGYVASASVSSSSTGSAIWKAFNKDTTSSEDCWYTGSVSMPQWIMLECPEPVRITSCMIANEVSTPVNFKSGYIQGSNDGSTFDTLYTITDRPDTTSLSETYTFTNDVYYKYLRVYCTASYGSGLSVQEIEFSGFVKDATAVPTLNTNAYTKTETDNLLSAKQDKLMAEAPLRIYPDTKQIPNVTLHDGATIDSNNIYHGGNGPYLSFNPGVDLGTVSSWGYRIKIKFPSWTTPTEYPYQALILNCDYSNNMQFVLDFIHDGSNYNKQTALFLSSNGTAWNIGQPTKNNSPFIEGGIYYIKFGFSGSQYYISYNETGWGDTFNTIASVNTSTKVVSLNNQDSQLGGPVQPFYGDIYLEESSLTVNGESSWTFTSLQSGVSCIGSNPATTSSLGVVQPDGTSITVSETGVISGQDVKTFTGYSDTGTLVLKSINGVLQWVAE